MAATIPLIRSATPADAIATVVPTTPPVLTIGEFFAHKNVFITGGTGFLGTVLIEAILGASPDVGNIFLLVRDKYGSNANARIKRMLTKQVLV